MWEAMGGDATGWGTIPIIELQKIPGLATGGTVTSSGKNPVLVGERGPEVLSLGRGATVTPLDHPSLNGSGGVVNLVVNNPLNEPTSTSTTKASALVAASMP